MPAMNKTELAQLIHNFRAGKASEAGEKKARGILADRSKGYFSARQCVVWGARDLKSRNVQFDQVSDTNLKPAKKLHFIDLYIAWPLLLSCLIAVSAVLYFNFPTREDQAMVDSSVYEIETKYGERRTILPDESSVVLNGNSKLKYSKNWSEQQIREVWIDGEGFFAVQHTKSHQKFIVHTREGLNVEVLGTKFNVKSREHGSEVLLTEGKVKLNVDNTASPVYLNPGELATMRKNKLSKRIVEGNQYTSWVKSKLVFDKMQLVELAQILQDTYGLKVSFQDEELKNRQLSGEISSATVDDILFAIAETFNVKVTKMDDESVIFSTK